MAVAQQQPSAHRRASREDAAAVAADGRRRERIAAKQTATTTAMVGQRVALESTVTIAASCFCAKSRSLVAARSSVRVREAGRCAARSSSNSSSSVCHAIVTLANEQGQQRRCLRRTKERLHKC